MKKLTTASLGIALSIAAFGQKEEMPEFRTYCSAAERINEILENDPAKRQLMEEADEWAQKWTNEHYGEELNINPLTGKKAPVYIIPVVWHVVHNGGPENLSRAAIEAEIDNLNEDYQKLNASIANVDPAFAPIAADCQIEFRLARLDPDGNCTEGITRTKNEITYNMNESAKFISGAESWNRNGRYYLNVWQGASIESGAGGYAYYPGTVPDNRDGIVLRSGQLGNTVSHELGHWFNIAHLWGNSNTPGDSGNCSSDDGVSDTPNTVGQTGCTSSANSCGSSDNGQNYMEYNFCEMMFTEGQKQRMWAALNSSVGKRNICVSASNLTNTGTADPYEQNPVCTPMGADFTYNKSYVCEGDQVTFQDQGTFNATPTMWDWTFQGGTPATSDQEMPVITYNTEGVYDVTYSPGTSAGFAAPASKTDIITVSSIVADYMVPFTDGFENTTTFNNEWIIDDNAPNGWQNTTAASYTGGRSARVLNRNNELNDYTELISPSYDLTNMTEPVLSYKYAFARQTSGGNDQFIVYYSLDCGENWTIKSVQVGGQMATGTATNTNWVPSGTNEWDEKIISLPDLAGNSNVRFKFRLKNSGGNNFYLDDINVDGNVGIQNTVVNKFKVFPNPMTESATLTFSLTENVKDLQIVLRDVLGKVVTRVVNSQSFSAGKYTMSLDKENILGNGMYFLEFNADGKVKTEKLIVK